MKGKTAKSRLAVGSGRVAKTTRRVGFCNSGRVRSLK